MVLKALEKHEKLTVEEIAQVTGRPRAMVEKEINQLWQQGKVCIDNEVCYISPKTSFPTMLLVTLLIFVCAFILLGAL